VTLPEPIARGVVAFNERRFFDAHEAWEEHWGKGPPEERALTLALVKAAVALHHLEAENPAGFAWQAERAVAPLRQHAGVWPELRTAELADALDSLAAQVRLARGVLASVDWPVLGPA
jgi:predicted metal-dependent hydrolase